VKRRGTAIRWRSSFDTVGHNLSGGSLHVSHSFALRAWPPPSYAKYPSSIVASSLFSSASKSPTADLLPKGTHRTEDSEREKSSPPGRARCNHRFSQISSLCARPYWTRVTNAPFATKGFVENACASPGHDDRGFLSTLNSREGVPGIDLATSYLLSNG
jgi:hypothetical protein